MYKQLEKYYLYLYNTVDVLIRTNKVVAMRLDEVKNNTNAEILNYFAQEKPKAFGTHYYLVKEGSHWEIGELNALHWLAKKITGLLGLGNIFYKTSSFFPKQCAGFASASASAAASASAPASASTPSYMCFLDSFSCF